MSFIAIITAMLKIGAAIAVIVAVIHYWLIGGPPPRGRGR